MMVFKKQIVYILGIVLVILLIPLIAMQFSDEVQWSGFDFVIAGILLFVFLSIMALLLRLKKPILRFLVIALFIILFVLLWMELAVGLFGSPFTGS